MQWKIFFHTFHMSKIQEKEYAMIVASQDWIGV
jgi:hypothetical protein